MKSRFLAGALLFFCFFSCEKADILGKETDCPECIESNLARFEKNACSSGATIKEYLFQNKTVYVLDPGPCGADMTSEVLDASTCTSMGLLGGIAGNRKINGEEFENARYLRTIWKN